MSVLDDIVRILQSRSRQKAAPQMPAPTSITSVPPCARCRMLSSGWPRRSTATASGSSASPLEASLCRLDPGVLFEP